MYDYHIFIIVNVIKKKISPRPPDSTDKVGRQVVVGKSTAAAAAQWCHPGRPQFTDPTRRAVNTSLDRRRRAQRSDQQCNQKANKKSHCWIAVRHRRLRLW